MVLATQSTLMPNRAMNQGTMARRPVPLAANETALIAAAQRGDRAAFNRLVSAYQAPVYRTAFRVLGNSDAAADATQEAFISAFQHLVSFHGGSFKAWLMRIVTNACYDQMRARQRRPTSSLEALLLASSPLSSAEPAAPESPDEVAERHELAAVIEQGVLRLPMEQRVTLVLADTEGFSYEEIAEMTRANVGTVKSRLARARASLRDFLLAQENLLPGRYRRAASAAAP